MMSAIDAPVQATQPLQQYLTKIGHTYLINVDYRVVAILSLAFVGLFCLIKHKKSGGWPSTWESLKVAIGIWSIFGGLTIFVVFVLTKPPECAELSAGDLGLIGILIFVLNFGVGLREIQSAFGKKDPAPAGPGSSTPPAP